MYIYKIKKYISKMDGREGWRERGKDGEKKEKRVREEDGQSKSRREGVRIGGREEVKHNRSPTSIDS